MNLPISVVIPAFNSEKFIREAIESVHHQTLQVDEIIVVDNNCTDNTVSIAESLGCKIIKQPIQNLAATRNAGIKVCQNEWIALFDSDDIWHQEKIELQWQAINNFPDAKVISCESDLLIKASSEIRKTESLMAEFVDAETGAFVKNGFGYFPTVNPHLYWHFAINASTALFHRSVFDKVGYFDESLKFAEEVEFFWRALAVFPIAVVKKTLVTTVRHDHNMTNNRFALIEGMAKVFDRMIKFPDNYPPGLGEFFLDNLKKATAIHLQAKAQNFE